MSILNKLSKLGAAAVLAASVFSMPAIAQNHGHQGQSTSSFSYQTASFQGQHRGNFRGNRGGNFRGNRRGNFRGNHRGNFRRNHRGNFRGNHRGNFRGHHGFKGNQFGHNGFRGNKFGHSGFRGNRFGHNGFRGNRFGNRSFRNGHNGARVNHSIYSVGGVYGVTGKTVFISDFGAHGLYSPPRGHHWVCDKGSKDAVLVAIATGAIVAIAADALLNPY